MLTLSSSKAWSVLLSAAVLLQTCCTRLQTRSARALHRIMRTDRSCTCQARTHADGLGWHEIASQANIRCDSQEVPRLSLCWQVVHGELVYQRMIGEGSFGTVWLAKWRETLVAVKKLSEPSQLSDSDEDRTQWRRMLQAMEKVLSCT